MDEFIQKNGSKNFLCLKCNKTFTKYSLIKKHLINNKNCDKKVEYKCFTCSKTFKDKTKFLIHQNTLKCRKKDCKDFQVQVNLHCCKYKDDIINNFVPSYIVHFFKHIYSHLHLIDEYSNVILKNIILFFNNLPENNVLDFYSLLISKIHKLNTKKIYFFYIIVQKNIQYFKNKEIIELWNSRIYNELQYNKNDKV